MRILIAAGYFAPYAPTAGVRPGKLAKYLLARGHDVRVLAAEHHQFPPILPREIPEQNVIYARCPDVNAPPRFAAAIMNRLRRLGSVQGNPVGDEKREAVTFKSGEAEADSTSRKRLRSLSELYTT